jgi:hypothetical protein
MEQQDLFLVSYLSGNLATVAFLLPFKIFVDWKCGSSGKGPEFNFQYYKKVILKSL